MIQFDDHIFFGGLVQPPTIVTPMYFTGPFFQGATVIPRNSNGVTHLWYLTSPTTFRCAAVGYAFALHPVDSGTIFAARVNGSAATSSNDGLNCLNAPSPFPPAPPVTSSTFPRVNREPKTKTDGNGKMVGNHGKL